MSGKLRSLIDWASTEKSLMAAEAIVTAEHERFAQDTT
jgi:hypothetical protein